MRLIYDYADFVNKISKAPTICRGLHAVCPTDTLRNAQDFGQVADFDNYIG